MPLQKNTIYFALLGFGKLGQGFYNVFSNKKEKLLKEIGYELKLKHILIKNANFKRPSNIDPNLFTTNVEDILKEKSIDVVIDAIGNIEPTYSILKKFILKKIHIISANRVLLATKLHEISDLANKNGIHFFTEASIGGGIPVTEIILRDLVGNSITEMYGLASGMSNYILSKMTDNKSSLDEVLKSPEIPKIAESVAVVEYEGTDAAMKVAILGATAFGVDINYLHVFAEGISNISVDDINWAESFGYEIKLLSILRDHGDLFEVRIHPTFIPLTHPMISVKGENNAYFIKTDLLGEYMVYGRGVGTGPTSSLILRDLVEIGHRINNRSRRQKLYFNWNKKKIMNINDVKTSCYIRFSCKDQPGVMREVTAIIGDHHINITSAHAEIGKNTSEKIGHVHIFLEDAKESEVQAAMKEIKTLDIVIGGVKYYRILDHE